MCEKALPPKEMDMTKSHVHFFCQAASIRIFFFCHLKISMCCKERPSLLIVHFFRYIRSRFLQQISYYLIELYCILWGDNRHI